MKLLDVKIIHCGIPTPGGGSEEKATAYCEFYSRAIKDIMTKVHNARVN